MSSYYWIDYIKLLGSSQPIGFCVSVQPVPDRNIADADTDTETMSCTTPIFLITFRSEKCFVFFIGSEFFNVLQSLTIINRGWNYPNLSKRDGKNEVVSKKFVFVLKEERKFCFPEDSFSLVKWWRPEQVWQDCHLG